MLLSRHVFRRLARRCAVAFDALSEGVDAATLLRLRSAGVFRLPIVFGDMRPGMCPTIVDVGAARGEAGSWALRVFPDATIHSFEPISSEYELLRAAAMSVPKWNVYHAALGEESGPRLLNVCDNIKQASSFYKPAQASIEGWPQFDFKTQHVEMVNVRTLDQFATDANLDAIDILKLDVQGAELEVLRGAVKTLPKVKYVVAEVSFQPMYDGGCLFPDVVAYLSSLGRYLRGLGNEVRDPSGRLLQADALFG